MSPKHPSPDLALYILAGCGFCARVLRAAKDLGLQLETRDIDHNPEFRRDLLQARGRATVPVLRIEHRDAPTEWMPESLDIVEYLERRYR